MGKIDDLQQTEDDREPKAQKGVKGAVDYSDQELAG